MDEGRVEEGRVVGWGCRPTVLPGEQRKGKSRRDEVWIRNSASSVEDDIAQRKAVSMFACQFYRGIDLGSEPTSVITKAYTAMRLLLSIHIDSSPDLELRLKSTIAMSSVWKEM